MRYEFFRALSALRFKSALSAYEPTMEILVHAELLKAEFLDKIHITCGLWNLFKLFPLEGFTLYVSDITLLSYCWTQIFDLEVYCPFAPSMAQHAETEIQRHGGVLVSGNNSRSGIVVFLVS